MARRSARLGAISVEVSADLGPMKQRFTEGKTAAAQAGREMGAAVASGFKQQMSALPRSAMNIADAATLDPESAKLRKQLQDASRNARMKGLDVAESRMQVLMGDQYDVRNNPFNAGRLMGGFDTPSTMGQGGGTLAGWAKRAAAMAAIGFAANAAHGIPATGFNNFLINRRAEYDVGQLRQQAGRLSAAGLDASGANAAIGATRANALLQKMEESRVPFARFIGDLTGASDSIRRHAASASAAATTIQRQIGVIRSIEVQIAGGPKFGMAQSPMLGLAAEHAKSLADIAQEEADELLKSPDDKSAIVSKFAERRAKQASLNKEQYKFASNVYGAEIGAMDIDWAASDTAFAGTQAELAGNSMAALAAQRQAQKESMIGKRDIALANAPFEKRWRMEAQYKKDDRQFDLETQLQIKSMAMNARPGMSMGGMDAMAVGGANATSQQNIANMPRLLEQILAELKVFNAPKHVNGN